MKKISTPLIPGLEYEEATRKPFSVVAVKVTMNNLVEIADWCRGEVSTAVVRLLGSDTELSCVQVPGNGTQKGEYVSAVVGMWVVENRGSFRVYRQDQYSASFDRGETVIVPVPVETSEVG